MIKAIFWDNDGVLVDTERLYFEANVSVLRDVGVTLTVERYRKHWLAASQGLIDVGTEAGLSPARITELREQRDAIYAVLLEQNEILVPGVEAVVRDIPSGIVNGIVTSSRRSHFDIIHRRTGLLPYFQFVVAEGDYKNSKPSPEPYLVALEKTGFAAEHCLVIEDSERGLAAATAAGLRCWIVRTELSAGADFSKAERVLDGISEIPKLLP